MGVWLFIEWSDIVEKSVYIDKKTYDGVNGIAINNKKEQMMLFGGIVEDSAVKIDSNSIKWFTEKELVHHDDESVEIDEGLLVKSIMDLSKNGYDAVFMVHSHPCETTFDDFLYGSLSSQDMVNSKRLYLVCQFQNVKYFDGISTGQHIYFWSIDNDNLTPVQMNVYVDNELVNDKVPGTIQELLDVIISKK